MCLGWFQFCLKAWLSAEAAGPYLKLKAEDFIELQNRPYLMASNRLMEV
jgi:hypothetical protein